MKIHSVFLLISLLFALACFPYITFAERPVLEMIPFQIPVETSTIISPSIETYHVTSTDQTVSIFDHSLEIRRRDIVTYDETTGRYTYIFWRENGSRVETLLELKNRVLVSVRCEVEYLQVQQMYAYTYHVSVDMKSPQALTTLAIEVDPELFTDATISSSDWHFFQPQKNRKPGSQVWAFWGGLGRDIVPGEELTIRVRSAYGPVIVPVYAQGRAAEFPRPEHVEKEAFGRHPANVEGVRGMTLAPGELDRENCEALFRKVLIEGGRWGWLDDGASQEIEENLTHSSSFSNMLPQLADSF